MSRRSSRIPHLPARPPQRRGVILLVVLSMLALFTLLVLTFVIYTSQHRKTAAAAAKSDRYDDAYADLLNRAVMQVIRGSDNPYSVVWTHSLLEDMYGNDWILGTLGSNATFSLANQVGYDSTGSSGVPSMMYFVVTLTGADGANGRLNYDDNGDTTIDDAGELGTSGSDDYKLTPGYYNGRVLTMIDGPAAGQSTRITGYSVDLSAGTAAIVMLPFDGMSNNGVSWNATGAPTSGNFIINGRPFSGTGFGFCESNAFGATPGHVNAVEPFTGFPYAVLPYPPSPLPDPTATNTTAYSDYVTYISGPDGVLGTRDDRINANEDYDIPDYNNMILAGRFWTGAGYEVALPSFVRPDLIRFFRQQAATNFTGSDASRAEILRRIFPRPLRLTGANPNFTGSNALMDNVTLDERNTSGDSAYWTDVADSTGATSGVIDIMESRAWDVDNDGDGKPDSVWTDFGFPVQTAADGRRYKPLVAVLCLDMDGRLNINAHGTNYHYAVNSSTGAEYYVGLNQLPGSFAGGQGYSSPVPMSTGLGSSVAEVSLGQSIGPSIVSSPYLASDGTTIVDEYRRLLLGGWPWDSQIQNINTARPLVEGRYGEGFLYYDGSGRFPMPGMTSSATPLTNGPDGTANTGDEVFDGDLNYPPAAMGFVANGACAGFRGDFSVNGYYPATSGAVGNLGTPIDLDGNGVMGLDLLGNPFYVLMGANSLPGFTAAPLGEAFNDPMEIDLSRKAMRTRTNTATGEVTTIDNPFTPADLESMLRRRDKDGRTLPDRLAKLAPRTFNSDRGAGSLTTESTHVPTPTVNLTRELRDLFGTGPVPTNLHINDLFTLKLLQGGVTLANINANLAIMVPSDLAAGLKLDLNRPLGNGVDDARADGVDLDGDGNAANDGNGVVDEPAEALAGEVLWSGSSLPGTVYMNHSNDAIPANRYLARQQLARQLYCLMMLLKDSGYIDPVSSEEGLSDAQRVEVTARRLAQWAINVVDYRDRDSIMTPFEYDVYPFTDSGTDGIAWDVDGWVGYNALTGAASTDDADLTNNPHRRLVWGCEQPDLLLTETLAFHDVRTTNGTVGMQNTVAMPNLDDDLDSEKLPQGSAFVEVYCPGNPNNTAFRGDLYRSNGYLDLGKMAPAGSSGAYPVWRMAVTWGRFDETGGPGASNTLAGTQNDVATTAGTRPDTTTFQPESMNFLNSLSIPGSGTVPAGETAAAVLTDPNINIERIVWFAAVRPVPGTTVDADKIYYNCGPGIAGTGDNVLLYPGQYAVVGPYRDASTGIGNFTTVGPSAAGSIAAEFFLGNAAAAALPDGTLNNGCRAPVKTTNIGGTDAYPVAGTDIQTPLGIAVAGDPAGTANAAFGGRIGFSISEPIHSGPNYYPPIDDPSITTTYEHFDGSDSEMEDNYSATAAVDTPFDHDASRPLGQNNMYQHGTYERYKTVFLQRLADPTQPWNPMPQNPDGTTNTDYDGTLPVNPYLTVDWMPIDLTVFNGEPVTPTGVTDPDATGGPAFYFGSRQRGFPRTPAASPDFNLWEQPPVSVKDNSDNSWVDASTKLTTVTTPMSDNPNATLGYINLPFTLPAAGAGYSAPGYLTSTNMTTKAPSYPTTYIGGPMPAQPGGAINGITYTMGASYPNLSWNNRPYTSGLEVLQVPASSPGRLLHEFSFGGGREYTRPAPGLAAEGAQFDKGDATARPFGHLLNMFTSSNDETAYIPTDKATARSNYHRVLDFLTVPSRFSGTKDALNPAAVWDTAAGSLPFHPPFNEVSRYREPGRVNINTVWDDGAIFRGIMNDYPGSLSMWLAIMQSRRGYGGVVVTPAQSLSYDANNNSPTIFANPFRSYGSGYNVPVPSLAFRNADPSGTVARRDIVEAGLLRPTPVDTDMNNFIPPNNPLFSNNPGFTSLYTADLTFTAPPMNATRNPQFRYQPFQKLDNVLSTTSNVYAIWITVGYFEVAPAAVSAAHPEGVELLGELGSDTGEITRHRGFYLFDRSIPVAFQRGVDHNVDKALLIRRIIE